MEVSVGIAAGMSMTVSTLMVSVDFRVMSMTHTLHMSLESVVLVGRVLHNTLCSIGLVHVHKWFLMVMLMEVSVGIAAGMSMTVSTVRVTTLMVSIDFRVMSMTHTLHMSLETMMLVGRVLDHSLSSIGLVQGVGSLDDISIPMFPLALVVSGVGILHSILELVAGMRMVVMMFELACSNYCYHNSNKNNLK
uniref:Uncharacterized protein n=1 Tax=Anopheles funestus TaxID=62324 RepID=A0A182RUH7_ANOFN